MQNFIPLSHQRHHGASLSALNRVLEKQQKTSLVLTSWKGNMFPARDPNPPEDVKNKPGSHYRPSLP